MMALTLTGETAFKRILKCMTKEYVRIYRQFPTQFVAVCTEGTKVLRCADRKTVYDLTAIIEKCSKNLK